MPWQPPKDDRIKAMALVVGLHLALGAALIAGLGGEVVRQASESLVTFDVAPPPPMPEPEPELEPPAPRTEQSARAAEEQAGAADLAARPAPVVVLPPAIRIPLPAPLETADERAPVVGRDASAGAASISGVGRGAGGSGEGSGGGGTDGGGAGGAGAGGGPAEEARLLTGNLTARDYRRIRSFGSTRGQATLAIEVSAQGQLTRCLPLGGSGNPALDAELCALLTRTRWAPARDRNGAPVAVALRYVARWDRD